MLKCYGSINLKYETPTLEPKKADSKLRYHHAFEMWGWDPLQIHGIGLRFNSGHDRYLEYYWCQGFCVKAHTLFSVIHKT